MANDSTTKLHLLALARADRAMGDDLKARADLSYERAEAFERAANLLGNAVVAGGVVTPARERASAERVGSKSPRQGGKGKPPGAMSQRWRKHFATIILMVPEPPHVFGFAQVQTVVKLVEGREVRPSEIRRLFEGNVKHGYLVQPSHDLYQPTQKLINLIGSVGNEQHEGLIAKDGLVVAIVDRHNENGAQNGNAASAPETGSEANPILPSILQPNVFD